MKLIGIWRSCFDKGVFNRLSRMLSNICKECCLTLEKGVFNV